jgi:uncharacterized protein (TIGR02996 family)
MSVDYPPANAIGRLPVEALGPFAGEFAATLVRPFVSEAEAARAGLMRAILERPDDDAPRLMLADWCDDNTRTGCGQCGGSGMRPVTLADIPPIRERVGPGGRIERYIVPGAPLLAYREPKCAACGGRGWRDNGNADRAAAIREDTATQWEHWAPWETVDSMPGVRAAKTRRGLVESIELPTADFLTHAARLFSAHPITRVTLTDRKPDEPYSPYVGWVKEDDTEGATTASRPDALPAALYDLLEGGKSRYDSVEWRWYGTPADACGALSAVCVAYGRRLAGLPEYIPQPKAAPDAEPAPSAHGRQ